MCIKLLRQIAHAHWAPRHEADSQLLAGIEQSILFRVAVHEGILCLKRGDGLNRVCFADGVGARFREAEMQHLAFLDKLFHGARNVLDWDIRIDPMLIEEIDVVRPETLEASVHHPLDVIGPAVQTALLGEIEAELRRDLHLVAERFERAADDGFARVRSVHFGRVEECHTVAVCLTDDLDGVVDGGCRAVVCGQVHAAKSEFRYFQRSKLSRFHVFSLNRDASFASSSDTRPEMRHDGSLID